MNDDIKWVNEKIQSLPKNNGLYKFVCMLLGKRKLSYKQMYLLLFNINKGKLGEEEAKLAAFNEIVKIYKHNNNEAII